MNIAVIVAAGTGTRFGGDIPKQFVEIAGKPVIVHTVGCFERCEAVDGIVVVTGSDQIDRMREVLAAEGFSKVADIVEGGPSRAESVSRGFEAAWKRSCDVVAIHDGARPVVSSADIAATFAAAERDGASCLVAPVTDTIKEVEFGKVIRTVDRNSLRRALTPQAFRPDVLNSAILSTDLDASITDEAMLVEKAGFEVSVVEGAATNIKITHPEDLLLAEAIIRNL